MLCGKDNRRRTFAVLLGTKLWWEKGELNTTAQLTKLYAENNSTMAIMNVAERDVSKYGIAESVLFEAVL